MKTTLHHYCFNLSKADEKVAYIDLLENTLKKIGFPAWSMNLSYGYTADPEGWQFMDKIRKYAGEVDLETKHLFDNHWNATASDGIGLRVFNWAECKYSNRHIKEGYWLDQTSAMRKILRNTHKCGYCGAQEPAQKRHVFCPHCIGNEHLTEKNLSLTRMVSVRDDNKPRAPLTDAEREHLLPVWREAQLHGTGERSIAAAVKARAAVEKNYRSAIAKAEAEYNGFLWLLDRGFQTSNVIYYSHAGRFGFGWRSPVDGDLLSNLLDVISEFPYPYDIKCAGGRTLSGG